MHVYEALATVLKQAGDAHHQAFIESDGFDPEWPLWYAQHSRDEINELLGVSWTVSELVYWFVHLDRLYQALSPAEPWATFYAEQLADAADRND